MATPNILYKKNLLCISFIFFATVFSFYKLPQFFFSQDDFEWLFLVKVLAQIPVLYMAYNFGRSVHALAGILAISLTLVLMFNPVA